MERPAFRLAPDKWPLPFFVLNRDNTTRPAIVHQADKQGNLGPNLLARAGVLQMLDRSAAEMAREALRRHQTGPLGDV